MVLLAFALMVAMIPATAASSLFDGFLDSDTNFCRLSGRREGCFYAFGTKMHSGQAGTSDCEEICTIFPFLRAQLSDYSCGSCQEAGSVTGQSIEAYNPGRLNVREAGVLLSEGLTARVLASTGDPVEYINGDESLELFHIKPDGAATFADPRQFNEGGWIYMSNSEASSSLDAGVGAITFDKDGEPIDYRMILKNTEKNCGGGRTPWGTWISGEETDDGQLWQVDPTGERDSEILTMSGNVELRGRFESFALDDRNRTVPRFFATKDEANGEVVRFTPDDPDWDGDPWSMLHGTGLIDYLILEATQESGGVFEWTTDQARAKENAELYFPNAEGIDRFGHELYLISKLLRKTFVLDLDAGTYTEFSTSGGRFDGQPDQLQRVHSLYDPNKPDPLLYFTEDGGNAAGIFVQSRDTKELIPLLEGIRLSAETSGLAFSPAGDRMYVAFQSDGILYEVRRRDGAVFS